MNSHILDQIERDGYAVLPSIYSQREVDHIISQLQESLAVAVNEKDLLHSKTGVVYGARNLLRVLPVAREMWRQPRLMEVLTAVLGPDFGLVRGLFFDKPPGDSWSLPWHRDLTIAVRDNRLPSECFQRPTTKAGLPHVEAPRTILDRMLTLRIHLDDVTQENGPLKVIAGSHQHDNDAMAESQSATDNMRDILAPSGDVLAMRPRIVHGSDGTSPDTKLHRRVIHLEFAADRDLPDGFEWADFHPV